MGKRLIFYSLFGAVCLWFYFQIQEREQGPGQESAAVQSAFPRGMKGSKEALVEKAWALMSTGEHDACMRFVDEELVKLEPAARSQEASLRTFPAMSNNYKWHDLDAAGNLLRVKQESLVQMRKIDEAIPVWEKMFRDFPHFQSWRAFPTTWQPATEARGQWQTQTMLRAIRKRDLAHYAFSMNTVFDTGVRPYAIEDVSKALLEKADFDGLDYAFEFLATNAQGQTLTKSKVLSELFHISVENEKDTDIQWLYRKAQIQKWIAAKPQSKAAKLMLAEFWKSYAWKARGSGPGREVGAADAKLFADRIGQAHAVLETASRELPMWYSLRMTLARAEGEEHETALALLQEGLKKFPWYADQQSEYLTYLLPRWHGKPGDWQAFALLMGKEQGPEAYLHLVTRAAFMEGVERVITDRSTDWELLKKGFEARLATEPDDISLPQQYAAYAWLRKDKVSAKRAFSLCRDEPHPDFFDALEGFDEVKKWAAN